jgi:hypothetical protein
VSWRPRRDRDFLPVCQQADRQKIEASVSEPTQVSEQWQRAFAWVESTLGGKVVRAERQPRWRPAWFIEVAPAGDPGAEPIAVYFRGERGESEHGVYTLEHEMRVLQLLEQHGIPVPHVYGFCPSPRGIVMEVSPGRVNLSTAESEAERRAVLDDYMAILARIHRIELSALDGLGIDPPANSRALGLSDFDGWERAYRRRKVRPEPIIEFLVRWIRRNVPTHRSRAGLVCSDSGQFLFENSAVTAVIDLELATLGDPMADLAGMRSRDLSEPMGDLGAAFQRYEKLSGEPLDRDAIDFHTIRFCTITPLAVAHLVAAPPAGVDWVQYLGWYCVWLRGPLEILAARLGVELEPVEPPRGTPTRHAPGHEALKAMLAPSASEDAFASYQRDAASRVAEYLLRADRFGAELERQNLADTAALLGSRPDNWQAAEQALEAWVESEAQQGDTQREADAVRLFHRIISRLEWILSPVMRELEGAKIQILG